ncbi:DEAD/DEAH box helicase family protein [Lysinibacillus sp. G01H]|uniref:DEAD/DEAH box helicase family protein n=1 Tax=Lysinibacillus sp. G01H TaxID=3026425 RepID=UPI00237E4315|nr:DEAD/DEAH box helicase family protein [Lysinibacillus sp. G01H]WDU78847.1 DEAD/DEAH box helicase family protein [Lysinibacillus sp. G01H]
MNFDFLKDKQTFNSFSRACIEAERAMQISPSTVAILSRRALELAVKWVYQFDNDVKIPYQDNLSSLIHDRHFLGIIDEELLPMMKYVVKLGNAAVHTNVAITRDEAVLSLHNLHQFVSWIDYCYAEEYTATEFDETLLYDADYKRERPEELSDLYDKLSEKDQSLEELRKQNEELRAQLTANRIESQQQYDFDVDTISEFETRKRYIDLDLKLAGWEIGKNVEVEYPVTGMPNAKGEGYVDYVLRGTNGKILAVVEAKRTSRDPKEGRNQAKLYADCIEQMQGLRPVIFYTNGFETHIWHDDYAARKVSGFYTQDELQLLIDRRKIKQPLLNVEINDDITNRYYQKEAILAICDTFSNNQRKGLLVMATGSGKTRTAISLVDVLTKQYWVKNVLFLADRTSLVKQAFRNFNTLLPNLSLSNMLEKNSNPEAARMVFSTYPTMMNAIDEVKRKDGNRLFTIGHFDLIIIDESHRSIYQKYKSIFDYFDGMLVGLTATPKDELDKNTYTIFDLENGVPTFAYELAKAVEDGYLVDYRTRETTLKILDDGIHYDDLSEAEKQEFDEIFEDEPQVKDIDSAAINNFVFNKNTIDHVLNDLMGHGLKVEGGDKLGKTIIFAKNHKHAMAIKERFDLKFPEYGGNFAEVIDYSVEYYQTLIDDFSDPAKMPQIAISVDMLDTGIDVPDVLNLVFFKKVRSKTKFWQMIGRGTRLRKDLFGPGMDKEYFLIFDYLRNFEYFRENEKGEETKISQTLTERLFNSKVDIVRELQSLQYQKEPFIGYREQLLKEIVTDVRALNDENFHVRQYLQYVHKYQNGNNWQMLSVVQTNEVKENVSPLIMPIEDDELAKRFDLLMLTIELASLQSNNATKPIRRVIDTAEALSKLGTIPQVLAQKDVIDDVRTTEFWEEASLADLERVRLALRDLIRYIERSNQKIYYTDFQDEVMTVAENKSILNVNDLKSYRKKVEHYLKEHQHEDTLAIYKLRNNKPLTKQDVEYLELILWNELGSKEQYEKDYGDTPVTKLVRKIVGLDRQAAVEAFSAFISEQQLTLQQTQFVELIIDFIVKNGTLERQALQQDPFSSTGGIMVVFKDQLPKARGILDIIDRINRNAEDIS